MSLGPHSTPSPRASKRTPGGGSLTTEPAMYNDEDEHLGNWQESELEPLYPMQRVGPIREGSPLDVDILRPSSNASTNPLVNSDDSRAVTLFKKEEVGSNEKFGESWRDVSGLAEGEEANNSTVYDHARARDAYEQKEKKNGDRRDGFCCQLGVTIKRTLILQVRQSCSFTCELVIPIIFVIGSIVLWAIFGNKKYGQMDYFNAVSLAATGPFYTQFLSQLCYNATVNVAGIGHLQECSSVVLMPKDELVCGDPAQSGTPSGLCVSRTGFYMSFHMWRWLVRGNSTFIPTLDEMIPLQWSNRILFDKSDLSTVWDKTSDAAMISSGQLFFAPDTEETAALVGYMNTSVYFPYVYGGTFANINEAENKVKKRTSKDPPNWGIVNVHSLKSYDFDVLIRLNASATPKTKKVLVKHYVGGIAKDATEMYVFSGFMTLQKTIYDYYLAKVVRATPQSTPTLIIPTPTLEYREQKFLAYGGQFAPLILVLGFLYPVSQMTKRIVLEKELRLREAMLIMGLPEVVMYMSWLVIYVVQYVVVSLIMTVLLKVTYTRKSNFFMLFFLIFFFALSTISLSGLMASFFNKARLSSILAPLIYFVLAIPLFAMQDAKNSVRTGIMFLSPSGFAVGLTTLFNHELAGGMHGSDLQFFRDHPTMLVCLVVLFCDFLIYALLMLYFDAVLPKEWGTRKHPLFFIIDPIRYCFGDRCCCGRRSRCCSCCGFVSGCDEDEDDVEDGRAPDGVYERGDVEETNCAIKIASLCKTYGRGKHKLVAVDHFCWSMKEGEISVLLGHNGAGKTTTMNMMTGMISATHGDCFIYGKSVRTQLAEVRKEVGYCPQHNILWPHLTCREHLWYYASIKGIRGAEREEYINRMLKGVDLVDKEHYKSKNLSGGQKRKLSVAVAFVGGSRLVFLDEPTAGMDVGARRHTWSLLRQMSSYHSILLTTHFMDEADLLGDYIAIMSKGRLQCAGSNMFLKSKLGVGYVVTMSVVPHVNRAAIEEMVRGYVPSAEQLGSGAGEVAFRLPMAFKRSFPSLLATVEKDGTKLGINAYSMSATTLEEIFIQIASKEEEKRMEDHLKQTGETEEVRVAERDEAAARAPRTVWNVDIITKTRSVMWSQFKAMMLKRFWNVLRDRRTQFFQIVCPVACVLLAMLLMLVKMFQSPDLLLSASMYDNSVEIDMEASCAPIEEYIGGLQHVSPWSSVDDAVGAAALSAYMLKTYDRHPTGEERYSGLVLSDATYGGANGVLYNTSALHELPLGLYHLYTGILQGTTGNTSALLKTSVFPMPRTKTEEEVTDSVYAMMVAIIIMIPFTFIPSTFVSWIVKERECKARHLQNVSGLFFSMYWFSNYLFDIACYLITMFLVIAVFGIFNRKEYIAGDNIGATIVLFFMYGLSGIAMAYALSFLFKEHSTAQNVVMLSNFIAGFLLVLCITMLQMIESTKSAAKIIRWFFRIVPCYCMGEGISNLAVLRMEKAFGTDKTAWSMNVVGWPCVYMAIELPVFVFITLFVDHPGRRQRSQRMFHNADAEPEEISDEDEDVIAERNDVLHSEERARDLVSVKYLRKVFPNGKVAVRNITFGVKPGEVFGFLGTNGAGKTTTISILCQEYYPTSGNGSICGYDIVSNSRDALRCIGYCPQFDATLDLLTVEEHLQLYAAVRGVTYSSRDKVVKDLISLCELTDYRNTKSHELSGGNRRKLSVAISLIGGPRVVFLDEPSAGMDPVARRGLWTAIESVADNCSVVLTTHHLEEVEALAHRVAIMVDGTLQCIGNKTHLKKKFGSGFEVALRVADDAPATREGIEHFFEMHFSGSKFREYRARRFIYELPGTIKLSEAFRLLEEMASELHITDYGVSQTSIEQVFLQISEEAERKAEQEHQDRIEQKEKCCACCACCH